MSQEETGRHFIDKNGVPVEVQRFTQVDGVPRETDYRLDMMDHAPSWVGPEAVNAAILQESMTRRMVEISKSLVLRDQDGERWLRERLAYWQRQLRLQDWDLTAEFATIIETGGKSGITWIGATSKEARIRIMCREEWPPPSERYGIWDEEMFLVHELIHLHLFAWKGANNDGEADHEAKEQAIDLIAAALLRFERGERR